MNMFAKIDKPSDGNNAWKRKVKCKGCGVWIVGRDGNKFLCDVCGRDRRKYIENNEDQNQR